MGMRLPIILSAILLSGCALLPTPFDSALYDHVVSLSATVDSISKDCGEPGMANDVEMLNFQSKVIVKYTEFTSKDVHQSVALVDKAITEMNNAYSVGTPSTAYCKLKLQIVDGELHEILTGIGGKQK